MEKTIYMHIDAKYCLLEHFCKLGKCIILHCYSFDLEINPFSLQNRCCEQSIYRGQTSEIAQKLNYIRIGAKYCLLEHFCKSRKCTILHCYSFDLEINLFSLQNICCAQSIYRGQTSEIAQKRNYIVKSGST